MVFDATHIVSLGGNCRVTYNIRKFFGFQSAYPFDWWITRLTAATAFLNEPSIELLYRPDLLAPLRKGKHIQSIVNTHYGMHLHHEFPRDRARHVVTDFAAFTAVPRARMTYVLEKMKQLNRPGNRLLLVRNYLPEDRHMHEQVSRLIEAAANYFRAADDLRFLFINPPAEAKRDDRVMTLQFADRRGGDWKGDVPQWQANLARVTVTYTPPQREEFGAADMNWGRLSKLDALPEKAS